VRVVVGSDDTYYIAKFIYEYLKKKGHELIPVGALKTGRLEPWPKVGFEVGKLVAEGKADMGIVICYTGTGVSIAANKVKGVRAALVTDAKNAEGARLWNDANVLAISARLTSEEVAKEILEAWFKVKEPDLSEKENIEMLKKLDEER